MWSNVLSKPAVADKDECFFTGSKYCAKVSGTNKKIMKNPK